MAPTAPRKLGGKRTRRGAVAGVAVPYDPDAQPSDRDPELDRPKPTPLFPAYAPPSPPPLSSVQKRRTAHLLAVLHGMRASSSSTQTLSVPSAQAPGRVSKPGRKKGKDVEAVISDPFRDVKRYSQRYTASANQGVTEGAGVQRAKMPLEFLPRELWGAVTGGDRRGRKTAQKQGAGLGKHKPKVLGLGSAVRTVGRGEGGDVGMVDADADIGKERGRARGRRVIDGDEEEEMGRGDVEDEEEEKGEDEEEEEERQQDEERDYEFDDDEDAGDYDAEQYFDTGGDEEGTFEAGGEGSGYFE